MDKYNHCNNCPNWYNTPKKYPSGYYDITICKKYNEELYYYANEENKTPVPCKECKKSFSYIPYIIFEKENKIMKTYKDILKTESELKEYYIENNMLENINLNIVGHFNNMVTLEMWFTNCCLFSNYNLNYIITDVLKCIVECLEIGDEDGIKLYDIKNIPVRIVCDHKMGKVIVFGHFMKNRFLLAEDIIELAKNNLKKI